MNALAHATSVREDTSVVLHVVGDAPTVRVQAPAWRKLLAHSSAATPMCSPEWLLTWLDIYGRGRELRVGSFYEGGQLIGLAPLCRRTFWHRPGIPFRRLEFLGSDVDEKDGVCTDYLGPIIRKGSEDAVLRAFVSALDHGRFGAWDECVFSAMDGASSLTEQFITALKQQGLAPEVLQTTSAPFIMLPPSWDDFLRGMPKKKRHSLTHGLRDFHAWVDADWRLEFARTPQEMERCLKVLADLHTKRWQAEGHSGAFGSPRFTAFHERFAQLALEHGWLLLMSIIVRGAPVAALYGFVADQKLYFYQCGRSLTGPPRIRLGIVAVILAMQEAISRGLLEFDFLGGQAQYKQLFTTVERPLVQVRLARRGPREVLRQQAHKALHLARSGRRGLGSIWRWLRPKPSPKSHATVQRDVNFD